VLTSIANAWKVPELRRRLAVTAFLLALYRLGSWLPVPGVNSASVRSLFNQSGSGTILGYLNLFSGQALQNLSLFALGIMPYITASIIMQLLAVAVPSLEKLQKEGEAGQRRLTQYTRYLTVALAAAQSSGYVILFHNGSALGASDVLPNLTIRKFIIIVVTLTAGTTLLMWIGELITRRGIGNGQSLLIFASIMVSIPTAISAWLNGSTFERLSLPLVVLAVIVLVVFLNEGQRRIPITYAKRAVSGGRTTTAGQSTYMPLRVNMAGVIPVIFAAAVLLLPPTIGQLVPSLKFLAVWFSPQTWTAIILEFALIVVFTFFYTAVQFNPVDQADNLKKYGGFIPGIRPGRPTAAYLDRVLTRLTLPGAIYLGLIAIMPTIFIKEAGFSQATSRALGGTSMLIVVGVALDTMRQIESQVMMRHYEGFLK
jgi:preprotein translocase subunit SecY